MFEGLPEIHRCEHCNQEIVGPAFVLGRRLFHEHCVAAYQRCQKGLKYDCPQCKTSGQVDDPSGRKIEKQVPLSSGESPSCAWNGCMGCHYCRSRVKDIEVPLKIRCDLCNGVGYLKQEPEAIQGVVGYRLKEG